MDFGGKAATTSAESLMDSRATSSSGTMLMSMNVCPINHDVVHVSLQAKSSRITVRCPLFCRRLNREYTVSHEPYFSGKARHGDPVRSIQCTALRKFQMSPAGRPRRGEPSVGRIGSSLSRGLQGCHSSALPCRYTVKTLPNPTSLFS